MIEISSSLLILLLEALVLLVIGIVIGVVISTRRKSRDREAARQLVDQIKHQSETRREHTGSFLEEKYRFEDQQLKQAVDAIDKSEKQFFQKVINLYLKRDAEALTSLDASVAEMIDVYKSLSPVMPDAETMEKLNSAASVGGADEAELEQLRTANAKLTEELSITKETMGNMIAEFGNMFGGGSDNELEQDEVVEKVQEQAESSDRSKASSPEDSEALPEEPELPEPEPEPEEPAETDDDVAIDEVSSDDDIDDLLNGIEGNK